MFLLKAFLVCMLGAISVGVSMAETTSTASAESATSSSAILGRLETRHGTILIHAGSRDERYTVIDKTGKEKAKSLSESQLQARFPEIHKAVKGAVADENLDASFIMHERPQPSTRPIFPRK